MMEAQIGKDRIEGSVKVILTSSDGRVFETNKAAVRQLKQLTTMLAAYEECEVTAPLQLDRIDGETLAAVLEWCELFPGIFSVSKTALELVL